MFHMVLTAKCSVGMCAAWPSGLMHAPFCILILLAFLIFLQNENARIDPAVQRDSREILTVCASYRT